MHRFLKRRDHSIHRVEAAPTVGKCADARQHDAVSGRHRARILRHNDRLADAGITRGALVAKLWIQEGELTDAEAEGARGEKAFLRILTWKSGTFENLPAEPNHERTILKPVNALLLESAQAIDENDGASGDSDEAAQTHRRTVWKLSLLARVGAEFVVAVPPEGQGEHEAMGTEDQTAGQYAQWTRRATEIIKRMGDAVDGGPLLHLDASNVERRLLLIPWENKNFLVGWSPETSDGLFEKTKKLVASWDS